jgi:short-subunit dehydrogenase
LIFSNAISFAKVGVAKDDSRCVSVGKMNEQPSIGMKITCVIFLLDCAYNLCAPGDLLESGEQVSLPLRSTVMNSVQTQGTALVTGASAGIGAVYAERLAKRGFDLLLVARDEQRLEAAASMLRAEHGVQVEVLKADLTQKDDVLKLEQRLRSDSSISLLLNNAGVAADGLLANSDMDQMEKLIQLNVTTVTRLASAAAAAFAKAGRGSIINIASVVALFPERFNATYSASKAYVLSLTQSLNAELDGTGVKVQAVLPGVTRTEIWERSGIDASQIPAEMVMEAGEMVDAALSGLDQGELITIPSLPNASDWDDFVKARLVMAPNLSKSTAATRYK